MNSSELKTPETVKASLRERRTQYALLGIFVGLAFPAIATVIKLVELHAPFTLSNILAAQGSDPVLWITDTAPFFLGLLAGIAGHREDLATHATALLQERETELNTIRTSLEENVLERTRQLDERNAEMRSVVSFARRVADIQDLPALLSASVQIINEQFEHFAANLYLLDETSQSAVLRASSAAGAMDGQHVAVGDRSVVGRVARRGKLLVAPVRPDSIGEVGRTAAGSAATTEIALPLVVHGRVIGVLDILSTAPEAPGQNQTDTLQLLADQLAAAIESVQLATESRTAIRQLEAVSAESTRAAWQQYLRDTTFAYQFTPAGVRSVTADSDGGKTGGTRLPIRLRGQQIGSISVQRSTGDHWTPTEQDLMDKLVAQIALALENARLIEETRQHAAQEQVVSEISARFSRSLDVEALLQAAVREFAALPDVAEATVVLKPTNEQAA